MREKISSSPSSIHIGLYKALSHSPDLMGTLAFAISLPFAFGFSHKRWQNSIHQMLQKTPGNPDITKLRIIQLVEADYNLYQKIKIGKEFMKYNEKNLSFPEEMHGGRSNKSTSDPIDSQRLLFDISRQNHTSLLSINLDAESCYDRMAPNFGTVSLSRLGLPTSCCIAMAKTQKNMSHKIGTIHGISRNSISQHKQEMWGGIGQGCAAAGPMWLAIETPIIRTFNQHNDLMLIESPDHKYTFNSQLLCYIDDTNINIAIPNSNQRLDLTALLNYVINEWHELISLSGASLSAHK